MKNCGTLRHRTATPHALSRVQPYINLSGTHVVFTSTGVSIDQPTAFLHNFEPAISRRSAHEINSEVIHTADGCPEDSLMEVVSPAFVKNHTVKINGLVWCKGFRRTSGSKTSRKSHGLLCYRGTIH